LPLDINVTSWFIIVQDRGKRYEIYR
jgi:hypothetical protein